MGSSMKESGHTDEKPQHKVSIAANFAVGRSEINFDQWDACTQAGSCAKADDDGYGRGACPAIYVSWDDANAYVKWLSEKTGKRYRLLSEAEFDYGACRYDNRVVLGRGRGELGFVHSLRVCQPAR